MFHIEKIKEKETEKTFKSLYEQNPYTENLNKISEILIIVEWDVRYWEVIVLSPLWLCMTESFLL